MYKNISLESKAQDLKYLEEYFKDFTSKFDLENIIDFIYLVYDEIHEIFEKSKYDVELTIPKKLFVEVFCKLYEILGGEVFDLSLHTFFKCAVAHEEDKEHQFTNEEIDEISKGEVDKVFRENQFPDINSELYQ